MTSIDFSSPRARASRGRAIVVGSGEPMRELATALRRAIPRVSECTDLYRAIDDVGSSSAREPVALVVVAADCEGFDAAACADAFRRVDPTVQLVLAVHRSQEDAVAGAIADGFEDSLSMPPDGAEIRAMLETLGLAEPARRPRDAAEHAPSEPPRVPEVRNVVEIAIKDAQARASAAVDLPLEPSVSPSAAASGGGHAHAAPSPAPAPSAAHSAGHAATGSGKSASQDAAAPRGARPPIAQDGRAPLQPPAAPMRAHSPKSTFTMPTVRRAETRRAADAPPGDLDLVAALLDGASVCDAAMRVLHHHLGSTDVRFVPAPRPGEELAVERERHTLHQARVETEAGTFGLLLSATIGAATLSTWAAWLAQWLLLDETHRNLHGLAFTDELTGAGNRRAFDRVCMDTIAAALAERRSFSLMVFDLDDFKQYNDRHGHEAGDEVLRETVELLQSCIRRGDRVFRIGGDEFVVLFCDTTGPRNGGSGVPESVESIATRFQRAVADLRFPSLGFDGPGTLTISAGVAVFPWEATDATTLLRVADLRALESKRAGKNVITFGPGQRSPGV